ncbi:hypothetical protein HCU64_04965 [Methylobacterium sp. C25]|uniref:hypothetical protein n=1 Tax=Methylobacterium sp. C25 TaxID=2721622 RepID=UPI001F309B87|nr:hypothetical protein [Methylobacterium sp. C25]MCE4223093.1 hypothetical protein [Methylobacterium sp. C25]
MSKWVPAVALIGLVCIMVLPTPGVLGIVIGTCCLLAIIVSAVALFFERILSRVIKPVTDAFRRAAKPKKRFADAGAVVGRKR